jgi:tRNA nucleotidyltransferase (CCA-adding enzyme)
VGRKPITRKALRPVEIKVPAELARVLAETPALHDAYLVGGCVRDSLLGLPVKDYDVEVHGVSYERLAAELGRWGRADLVGRSFGVVKLTLPDGRTYDFSVPRRDSKTAPGHKGFEVSFDPDISVEEAASRRDFTVNSMMHDPRRQRVLDPFDGEADLRNGILRHTSPAFAEDPLRVLRGMQFAGRFRLTAAPETVALCRRIKSHYRELAVERVREEWFKWAAESQAPSRGLHFLAETEWIDHFPEIKALLGVPQDPGWHPEGDVFTHTCHCCDALAGLPGFVALDRISRVVYMLAVLAHDFAKPGTTAQALKSGQLRIVSPGHEEAGGPLAEQFLVRIDAPAAVRSRVVPLVRNHLAHLQTLSPRAVRRLAKRLEPETIDGLCLVITADQFGRPPKPRELSRELLELRARAVELNLEKAPPQPILMGRHLLEHGLHSGRGVGVIVAAAFEAQLEGHFADLPGALRWVAAQNDLPVPLEIRETLRQGQA